MKEFIKKHIDLKKKLRKASDEGKGLRLNAYEIEVIESVVSNGWDEDMVDE